MKYSTDIWFCAYLLHKGHELNDYTKENGKVTCIFKLSDEAWAQERKDYLNSEFSKYKSSVEQVMNLRY